MSKSSPARELARFGALLKFQNLPREVVDKVKVCLYHVLYCSFVGHDLPWSKTARQTAKELDGKPEATIFVYGDRCSCTEAAFANAVLSHSIIQEDMHSKSLSHPGSVVIPASLALGEKLGVSGKDLISAIVVGYEVMCRVGASVASADFVSRFRSSGFFGPFGSAVAAAKMMGFSEDEIVGAIGLAGNLSMGLNEWARAKTNEVFFHNGFAARNGIVAAMLTKNGLWGAESILEGSSGLWAGYGGYDRADEITRELGKTFEIMSVWPKPIPACALNSSPIQLALNMAKDNDIDPRQIKEIAIKTNKVGKDNPGCDNPGPFYSINEAKMSVQFGVASALIFKKVVDENFRKYDDPIVATLAKKARVVVDPDIDKLWPGKQAQKIEILMNNGRVIAGEHDDLRHLTRDDVVGNLRSYAERIIGEGKTEELVSKIEDLELLKDISDLATCFAR